MLPLFDNERLLKHYHRRSNLRFLQRQLGTWAVVADGLRTTAGTLKGVMGGGDDVSASLALRVARLMGVMVDDLLVGKFLPPGAALTAAMWSRRTSPTTQPLWKMRRACPPSS